MPHSTDRARRVPQSKQFSGHQIARWQKTAGVAICPGKLLQALRTISASCSRGDFLLEFDMIEGHFKDWAEADEVQFYDLQKLFVRHMWIEGEFFLHRFFDHDLLKRGLCPLGLEILETDFLDSSINAVSENGNTIKGGIEYNRLGRPVAYHLFKEHPGESIWGTSFGDTHRIPATEVKHVFHKRRASQGRGVSWLASIIMEMRDFSEYQTNERIASRLAAAFGIFIESPYPEHQIRHPFDGIEEDNVPSISDIPKYLEPGRIDVLPTGMKISSAQFNRPGQTYEPFTKTSLKSASTGTPLSYENFSNDYEGATYSSARQAVLEEMLGYRFSGPGLRKILSSKGLREASGLPLIPSPVHDGWARTSGSKGSRHYAVGRLSDAGDIFPARGRLMECGLRAQERTEIGGHWPHLLGAREPISILVPAQDPARVLAGGQPAHQHGGMMDLDKLINRNNFFRRFVLVSMLILIFIVVLWTWYAPPTNIPQGTAIALGTVVGMLSAVIGFYQWSRSKDDETARERRERDAAQ